MGWISILDPLAMAEILDIPTDWRLIGYFCLGYPLAEDDRPELERLLGGTSAYGRFYFSAMIAPVHATSCAAAASSLDLVAAVPDLRESIFAF